MGRPSSKAGAVAVLSASLVGLIVIACAEGSTEEPSGFAGENPDAGRVEAASLPPREDSGTEPDPEDDAGSKKDSGKTVSAACTAALDAAKFDFESGTQGWTTAISDGVSPPPVWPYNPWGHGTASKGTACSSGKCFGAELTQNYAQCQRGHLLSPKIDLAACKGENVTLTFRHAFAFWSEGTAALDGGIVEVSADDGSTWEIPVGTYPGTIKIRGASFGLSCVKSTNFRVHDKNGFVQKQTATSDFDVALPAALITSSMRVRFSVGSGINYDGTDPDDSRQNTDFGWRIDDVHFLVK